MDIKIENISVAFDEKSVYDNFSLHINSGEFVCVLGKSGCGKTVLLNTILGALTPSTGEITLGDIVVKKPTKNVGVVYQDFFILPWLTLRRNLKLTNASDEGIENVAAKLKISEYLDLLPKQVSIGTKQRTSIARALLMNSNILLMDEPLCSVDAITAQEIRKEIKSLTNNRTVFYITHNVDEAVFLSSRIVCLDVGGKILLDRPSVNIKSSDILEILEKGEQNVLSN